MSKWLFNAVTARSILVNERSITRLKKNEYLFDSLEEITCAVKRRLVNSVMLDDEYFIPMYGMKKYQISNYGRVKSFGLQKQGRILVPFNNRAKTDYPGVKVKIMWNGKKVHKQVSHIMKDHFKLKGKGDLVYHMDGNPFNNHVTNLKLITNKELIKSATRATKTPIVQLSLDGEIIDYFSSIHEAAKETKIAYNTIWRGLRRKSKIARGYIWEYDIDKY